MTRQRDFERPDSIGSRIALEAVARLPRRALTELAGRAAQLSVPPAARRSLYGAFARAVGANVGEAAEPLDTFSTFNEFFTRRLRDGVHRLESDEAVASPADGRLDQIGRIERGRLIQAKGLDYSLADLVRDEQLAEALEGGMFATVYLSPADYHRVHSPFDYRVDRITHVGGELWPVNNVSVPWVRSLFTVNERVVMSGRTPDGLAASVVMVGATVVGGIEVFDARAKIGERAHGQTATVLQPPVRRAAMDELGAFRLGSTVIIALADPARRLESGAMPGSRVRVGQSLFVRRSTK
jgi:phosphatidylserine decarboxylase